MGLASEASHLRVSWGVSPLPDGHPNLRVFGEWDSQDREAVDD